jgi:hypothetical protein
MGGWVAGKAGLRIAYSNQKWQKRKLTKIAQAARRAIFGNFFLFCVVNK